MKIFQLLFLLALGAAMLGAGVPGVRAAERIESFDARIQMDAESALEVEESIVYDFGGVERHGIYRDIPIRYGARGGNYTLRISDISVVDENGVPYEFEASHRGNYEDIKIGSADVLLAGRRTFVIRYRIQRAINFFPQRDELYWNVTGDDWSVPIGRASVRVMFPTEITAGTTQAACYAGAAGATGGCVAANFLPAASGDKVNGAYFAAGALEAGEEMTVVVGLPKGTVRQPTPLENFLATLGDNWILLLPLLVFIVHFYLWWTRGRDPKGQGTIIPEFDVPDRLTPAEVGTVVDENCGQKELVAEIISLAERGYLKLRREEEKGLLGKTTDYVFTRLKDGADLGEKHEADLLAGLFGSGQTSVRLSALKDFHGDYERFTKEVYRAVFEKGYFSRDPRKVVREYTSFLAFLILAFLMLVFVGNEITGLTGAFGIFAIILSAIIILAFAHAMPQKTYRGVLAKEHILGLKDYLSVAEKDRLEFHNAPEKNPQQFEKLLPYAIALGVEKQWARQFEGLYDRQPGWYEDSRALGSFNAMLFAQSLGDFRTSMASSALAAASTGASGLGGGGGAGGGFGGGGGGSW